MRREITTELINWKNDFDKKVLIVTGARQVGKTYIIREFAKEYYTNLVEINLLNSKDARNIFKGNLILKDMIAQISLLNNGAKIEKGKTLIFFDEIQASPDAIVALKIFGDQSGYDVIASGSLLGVSLNSVRSYPVGYVKNITLYPFSFKEFLWANNVNDDMINELEECYKMKKQVNEVIHLKMIDYFLKYIVVGGMPSVIKAYLSRNDFSKVIEEQSEIVDNYRNDIAKYASKIIKERVKDCFDSIPNQLAKDNKKYQYKLVKEGGNAQYFSNSIGWICDSGIADKLFRLKAIERPLKAYKSVSAFKIYLNDTGLLLSMYEEPAIMQKILNGDLGVFKGGVFENVIYTTLRRNFKNLYYFEKGQTEIDFITVINDDIVPIEVKSNINARSYSLKEYIKRYNCKRAIKLSLNNVNCNNEIIECYPLYMAEFIKND